MNRFSGGRVALGMLLAVLGAVVTLPTLPFFGSAFLLSPVGIALLYAWAGAVPAALMAALVLIAPALSVGMMGFGIGLPLFQMVAEAAGAVVREPVWMTIATLALVAPGIGSIVLLKKRWPFARAMTASIAIQLLGIVACVFVMTAREGPDLIGELMGWFRAALDSVPVGSQTSETMSVMLIQMGRYGLFGASSGIDFARDTLTTVERTQLTELLMNLFDVTLRRNLLSMLLVSGVTTGLLSYGLPARMCARRGDEPVVPYKHIHEWRMPAHLLIGLPVIAFAFTAANSMGVGGADSIQVATRNLCYFVYALQGAGALARRLRQGGMVPRTRMLMLGAMFIVGQWMLSMFGLWSGMFGSQGIWTEYMKKRNRSKGDGDR